MWHSRFSTFQDLINRFENRSICLTKSREDFHCRQRQKFAGNFSQCQTRYYEAFAARLSKVLEDFSLEWNVSWRLLEFILDRTLFDYWISKAASGCVTSRKPQKAFDYDVKFSTQSFWTAVWFIEVRSIESNRMSATKQFTRTRKEGFVNQRLNRWSRMTNVTHIELLPDPNSCIINAHCCGRKLLAHEKETGSWESFYSWIKLLNKLRRQQQRTNKPKVFSQSNGNRSTSI